MSSGEDLVRSTVSAMCRKHASHGYDVGNDRLITNMVACAVLEANETADPGPFLARMVDAHRAFIAKWKRDKTEAKYVPKLERWVAERRWMYPPAEPEPVKPPDWMQDV